MSLSGLKDIDREILKYVTDEELLKVCFDKQKNVGRGVRRQFLKKAPFQIS